MREIVIKKAKLHETQPRDDLRDKSPDELIGMMWQLALNAWSFKETVDVEPRLQRHVVVLKRGRTWDSTGSGSDLVSDQAVCAT